jgi:putative spermidine/putrescine transport system permease protein
MTPRPVLGAFSVPGLILLLLFFVLPLGVVVGEAFTDGGSAFVRMAADPVFWRGLGGSLVLGLSAPLIATLIGFLVALHLAKLRPGTRTTLLFLISLPLTFSGLIIAYGFILVFGRAGFVTLLLAELGADPAVVGGMLFTPLGLAAAYNYYLIPRVVMVVLPVVLNFDQAQLAAARSLGAHPLRAHLDVLIPQVFPSLVAAFCLCAAVALGAYGTALALVGTQVNILPLVLYSKISETGTDFPVAAATSVVLMGLCCLVIAVAELFARRPAVAGARQSDSSAHASRAAGA